MDAPPEKTPEQLVKPHVPDGSPLEPPLKMKPKRHRLRKACLHCRRTHVACNDFRPCLECALRNIACTDSAEHNIPGGRANKAAANQNSASGSDPRTSRFVLHDVSKFTNGRPPQAIASSQQPNAGVNNAAMNPLRSAPTPNHYPPPPGGIPNPQPAPDYYTTPYYTQNHHPPPQASLHSDSLMSALQRGRGIPGMPPMPMPSLMMYRTAPPYPMLQHYNNAHVSQYPPYASAPGYYGLPRTSGPDGFYQLDPVTAEQYEGALAAAAAADAAAAEEQRALASANYEFVRQHLPGGPGGESRLALAFNGYSHQRQQAGARLPEHSPHPFASDAITLRPDGTPPTSHAGSATNVSNITSSNGSTSSTMTGIGSGISVKSEGDGIGSLLTPPDCHLPSVGLALDGADGARKRKGDS